MRKLVVVCLLLVLIGCAGVKLTPEMTRISSVSDTSKCVFVGHFTVLTEPYDMLRYVQYNTAVFGGDSFKIIAALNQRIGDIGGFVSTTFEMYKCR